MNIEELARIAINTIKDKWGLPDKGLLAGGSLANLVYNLIHNENAPVNDIDVFILDEENTSDEKLFVFTEEKKVYKINEYDQLFINSVINERYHIVESYDEGIYNYIFYKSKSKDYSIIIRSFDLNCTKIGYIIEEDKFIIDESYIDFIKTKFIRLDNLNTPYHSAIRLAKKNVELNAFVEKFEFDLIQHAIKSNLSGIVRSGFKEKYKDIYIKYKSILDNYFELFLDINKTEYVKFNFKIDSKIYSIKSKFPEKALIFKDENLKSIYKCKDFLFYMRNIYGNEDKKYLWSKIRLIYNGKDDLEDVSKEQVDLLRKLITYAPKTINILENLTLKQQLNLINKTIECFNYNYESALLYLENYTETNVDKLDDFTKLCIEIGLRRKKDRIEYKLDKIFDIINFVNLQRINDEIAVL